MLPHHRAARTARACKDGADWLAAGGGDDGRRHTSAARCLVAGTGQWVPLDPGATEPYLMDPAWQGGRRDEKWWGRCDTDLHTNQSIPASRPARPSLLFTWEPEGDGCADLRKHRSVLPDLAALACAFCSRWAGRSILFVGDSVQGELFHSFAHVLGAVSSLAPPTGQVNEACRAWVEGSGYESDLTVDLCEAGERAVHARFVRNEMLWLDNERNGRGRTKGTKLNLPVRVLCEWDAAAAEADAIVLNRGYHSLGSEISELKADLNDTFAGLEALLKARRRHDRSHAPARVVYRGTHASIYKCAEYADPLQPSIPGVHAVTHAMHIHRSNANSWYAWRNVYAHHRLDQDAMASMGVTYLNTFTATSLRPGGRLSPQDCNHFCLPGPPDEWTRMLLAFLT